MAYHWTENADEIVTLAPLADALEIAPCRDLGDCVERCDGDSQDADMWSIYFHFTPIWKADPNDLQSAPCIADRDTREEAEAFAEELGAKLKLPINLLI